MSEIRSIVENILKKNLSFLKEAVEDVVYRTYGNEHYLDNNIYASEMNKPRGGLWGCRDDSWKNWCNEEEFRCSDNYFEWTLKPGSKVFTIDSSNDFLDLLENYASPDDDGNLYIDFMELSHDYDAVELTERGNRALHFSIKNPEYESRGYKRALTIALNLWDVPSICVFRPRECVEVINQ